VSLLWLVQYFAVRKQIYKLKWYSGYCLAISV
jgi:hypothetical protein